jgi:hypothetical protein
MAIDINVSITHRLSPEAEAVMTRALAQGRKEKAAPVPVDLDLQKITADVQEIFRMLDQDVPGRAWAESIEALLPRVDVIEQSMTDLLAGVAADRSAFTGFERDLAMFAGKVGALSATVATLQATQANTDKQLDARVTTLRMQGEVGAVTKAIVDKIGPLRDEVDRIVLGLDDIQRRIAPLAEHVIRLDQEVSRLRLAKEGAALSIAAAHAIHAAAEIEEAAPGQPAPADHPSDGPEPEAPTCSTPAPEAPAKVPDPAKPSSFAAALVSAPPPRADKPKRIRADFAQIERWAAERGLAFLSATDLDAVNKRAAVIGHPGFDLHTARH